MVKNKQDTGAKVVYSDPDGFEIHKIKQPDSNLTYKFKVWDTEMKGYLRATTIIAVFGERKNAVGNPKWEIGVECHQSGTHAELKPALKVFEEAMKFIDKESTK